MRTEMTPVGRSFMYDQTMLNGSAAVRLALFLTIGSDLAAAAPRVRFDAKPNNFTVPVNTGPGVPLAVGDLNNDGVPDLLIFDGILLGTRQGLLTPGPRIALGTPISITLADLNGDGNLDIILIPDMGESISIMLGNGDATFQAAKSYPFNGANALVTGDFNHDGKLDLAVIPFAGGLVFFPGNGDGTLGSPVDSSTLPNVIGLVAGDFNNDGILDIATAIQGSPGVSISLGNGDGKFGTNTGFPIQMDQIEVGDLNRDGNLDLVGTAYEYWVSIALGNGDGTLQAQDLIDLPFSALYSALADFNGDGIPDIVAVGETASGETNIEILLGNGDGTFQSGTPQAIPGRPYFVKTTDFNSDGRVDAVSITSIGTVSIDYGTGTGVFSAPPVFSAGSNPGVQGLAQGDLNGDGTLDIVTANSATNNISVLLGEGKGRFHAPFQFATGTTPVSVALGDFNGDGILDAVTADSGSRTVTVLFGHGNGSFTLDKSLTVSSPPTSVAVGDINGDGKVDIVVATDLFVDVFLGNGHGGFTAVGSVSPSSPIYPPALFVALADVNNDGKLDLLTVVAGGTIDIALGAGDGTFGPSAIIEDFFSPESVSVADMDGDGNLDLIVGQPASSELLGYYGSVSVLLGNGNGTFQASTSTRVGVSGTVGVSVADFNGDGIPDVAASSGDGVWILTGRGDGTLETANGYSCGCGDANYVLTGNYGGSSSPDVVIGTSSGIELLINLTQ